MSWQGELIPLSPLKVSIDIFHDLEKKTFLIIMRILDYIFNLCKDIVTYLYHQTFPPLARGNDADMSRVSK